jgi:PIN domain nuclease of toxin-antitoxin system
MLIKHQFGKLTLRLGVADILAQQIANGVAILNITLDHALAVATLTPHHKDPFDRMLVAQTNVEGAFLVSADPIFSKYPVRVEW